jgi:hypothetical protein
MSEFFAIVSLALTGLLDITNQAIGILIAWTILDVPLLFILVVFDFMKTLLEELGIKKENDEGETPFFGSGTFKSIPFGEISKSDISDAIDGEISSLARRQGAPVSFEQRQRIVKKVQRIYGLILDEEDED